MMFGMIPFDRRDDNLFDMFDNFEKKFFGNTNASLPAFRTDIRDQGDKFLLEAELPGFQKEDDHLAQMIELLGPIPVELIFTGKFTDKYFTRQGVLRHIRQEELRPWSLKPLLMVCSLACVSRVDLFSCVLLVLCVCVW